MKVLSTVALLGLLALTASATTHRFDPEAEDFGYVNEKPTINQGAKEDSEKKFPPVSIVL